MFLGNSRVIGFTFLSISANKPVLYKIIAPDTPPRAAVQYSIFLIFYHILNKVIEIMVCQR